MQTLFDIEEIKQLKARYFRGIDTCQLELLHTVLSKDVHIRFDSPTYQYEINGINEAMDFYRNAFTHRRFGMHNGHTPEINVEGDSATGIWYLNDLFINLDEQTILTGSALYEDCYIKVAGQWRIQRTGYKRLLEMIEPLSSDCRITSRPIASN
ncbi:nuclear transport factor 2 family protein [Comamonas sp. 26]|uniref:nuclear transport factor 2 family protein n=1 Tax=Comamonas sp. 26 TaxID=2035201 RepID=UPI000C178C31|nr:nuclear transport factor 2 family protein [Comamonas sp. 26]PIG09695.1 SnoaL-like protein [Comamonas sp. 26]